MAKEKTYYICSDCGHKSPKWQGQCPMCKNWGTIEEEVTIPSGPSGKALKKIFQKGDDIKVYSLDEIEIENDFRYKTNLREFDRVLGGGLVKGEVVLLTGNPGIGKSTILLQGAKEYCAYGETLYVLGEESPTQVKSRGKRLGITSPNLRVMPETSIEKIYEYVVTKKPKVVIIDSIQTLYSEGLDSIPGTPTQIRECTLKVVEIAKTYDISFFIVGHITKDGKVAGPKMLEHMVDAVLTFEGEEGLYYRILRSIKNRFGSTNEIGIFNMEEDGMKEVLNSSEFFLSERDEKNIGSMIVPVLEGSKVFMLEIQALITDSPFGIPKRIVQGLDRNRIQILTALGEKKMGINLGTKDLFINVPGGIGIKDQVADLATIIAIMSVVKGVEISQKVAAIGELGLRGEIRKVAFMDKRLKELEKLGFTGVYIPLANKKDVEKSTYDLKIIYLKNLDDLIERVK